MASSVLDSVLHRSCILVAQEKFRSLCVSVEGSDVNMGFDQKGEVLFDDEWEAYNGDNITLTGDSDDGVRDNDNDIDNDINNDDNISYANINIDNHNTSNQ